MESVREKFHQRLRSAKERDKEISLAQADRAKHVCDYMGPNHDGENIIISQQLTKYRRWKYCKQCHRTTCHVLKPQWYGIAVVNTWVR